MLIVKNNPVEKDIRESVIADMTELNNPAVTVLNEVPDDSMTVELTDDRKQYGRTNGSTNIPPFLRNTIAVAAHHDSNKNVARAFGVSRQEVSILKNARLATSKDEYGKDVIDANSPENTGLREAVNKDLAEIRQQATNKLLLSLKSMTPERISALPKLIETAQFADTMSKIIERTIPKDKDNGLDHGAKFIFIVPETRKTVADYPVVTVEQPLD